MTYVISMEKKIAVITALVEGCSVRSTVRMTGVSKGAVLRLLVSVGAACARYQSEAIRNVSSKRVQVDEIWSFYYCKQKNLTPEIAEERIAGDVWTFTAIDAETKLVLSWLVGRRDVGCAAEFLQDVAGRLQAQGPNPVDHGRPQDVLTAVPDAFGSDIDYAQLVKVYGNDPVEGQKRYSPAQCLGTQRVEVIGSPDQDHISTSYVERQNVNMRMNMRRFTRLTNAFSKKIDNQIGRAHV